MHPLDQEFVRIMLHVEQRYLELTKHQKIRVEQWTKKLCQATTNSLWKKNRNHYAKLLLLQIHNKKLETPFIKTVPNSPLPTLNVNNTWLSKASKLFQQYEGTFEIQKNMDETSIHEENTILSQGQIGNRFQDINLLWDCYRLLKKHKNLIESDSQIEKIISKLQKRLQGQTIQTDNLIEQLNEFQRKTIQLKKETQFILGIKN